MNIRATVTGPAGSMVFRIEGDWYEVKEIMAAECLRRGWTTRKLSTAPHIWMSSVRGPKNHWSEWLYDIGTDSDHQNGTVGKLLFAAVV